MATINYTNTSGIITGTGSADTITAGLGDTGNDRIVALGGDDGIFSGGGGDFVLGGSGTDLLSGESGNDKLFGGTGSDDIFGGSGDDTLFVETNLSNFGTDSFSGGTGFDTLAFGTGDFISVNGTPNQVFFNDPETGVSVNLVNTFAAGITTTFQQGTGGGVDFVNLGSELGRIRGANGTAPLLADIERIQLTKFDDQIFDSSAAHELRGGDGDDYISGGGGADVIDGGDGNDTALYGGSPQAVSIILLEITPGEGGTGSGGDAENEILIGIENVFCSQHDDFVLGDGGANTILGRDGNDSLLGGGGEDTLNGEAGDDTLRGGLGNDRADGGEGSDLALFLDWNGTSTTPLTPVSTVITLASGEAEGTAVLLRKTLTKSGFVTTTLETDTLVSVEKVTGTDFFDTIKGNDSDNTLNGADGNDLLDGGRGSDILNGGDGTDTASFAIGTIFEFERADASLLTGKAAVSRSHFELSKVVTTVETDTLQSIENLTGTTGNDKLTGNSAVNVLDGGNGDDTLAGLGGGDKLIGGNGSDTADYSASASAVFMSVAGGSGGDAAGDQLSSIENLIGSGLNDVLSGDANANKLSGGDGDDVIEGGAGADTMDGGDGTDTLSYKNSAAGVTMSLDGGLAGAGDAAGDSATGFENIAGSATGGDTLRGDDGKNIVGGNGGDDILAGMAGGDKLIGGDGVDMADYRAEEGVTVDMQNAIFDGAAFGDVFDGIEGIFGGKGDNSLKGDGEANIFEVLTGTNLLLGRGGEDILTGGGGRDNISGGTENDTLSGNGLRDRLTGNAGDDTLDGGDGSDDLTGGTGSDTQSGGAGKDTFIFTGNAGLDTILDFEDGADLIEIGNNKVAAFADLAIANNGTAHVTVSYGVNTIEIFGAAPITLTAEDFSIL